MLCLLALAGWPAGAASFDLGVRAQPNPVLLSETVTLRINLTNVAGFTVTDLRVTNVLPASLNLLSASNSIGEVTASSNLVVFTALQLLNSNSALFTITAEPTALGTFTNVVIASALEVTNVTNSVVFSTFFSRSDLGVSLVPPPEGTFENDFVSYSIIVSNRGPDSVANLTLSNALPTNAVLIDLSPNTNVFLTNHALVFNLGSLASNATATFQVTVQPTNAGTAFLQANVSAAGNNDTNAANNVATNSFTVSAFAPGDLFASVVSAQTFNPQTGLMEQTIALTNLGTNDVAAARVFVGGLTNVLYNAVGTNGGNPFVVYAHALAVGASVDLLLEYFIPTRLPVPDPILGAAAIAAVSNSVPATSPPNLTKIVDLGGGSALIEFQSEAGRRYTVVYADNVDFTNALSAQPAIVAPADRTQWIDDGPPKTISKPTNGFRFYRVFLNP
jgi:uncharacterized repeat protein (TIGR01451 family)